MWDLFSGMCYLLVTAMWQCCAGLFMISKWLWKTCTMGMLFDKRDMVMKAFRKRCCKKGCRGVHLCRTSVANRGVKVKSWKAVKTKRRQWLKLQARLAWYAKLSHWAHSCLVYVILCCLRGSGVILHVTKKAKTSNSAMSKLFMSSLRGEAASDETSTICIECSNASSALVSTSSLACPI